MLSSRGIPTTTTIVYYTDYVISPPQKNNLPNLFNNNSKGGTPMCKYDSQPAAFSRMENEKLRRLRDLPTDEALKLFSALFFVWILKVWVHLPQQNTKSVV